MTFWILEIVLEPAAVGDATSQRIRRSPPVATDAGVSGPWVLGNNPVIAG